MDLTAWQKGHKLVLAIYLVTKTFPREEVFGLSNQLRRAAVSITSNIAEGFGRRTYREKHRFYIIATGSLTELQNQLFIAKDVKYITAKHFEKLYNRTVTVQKILSGLIRCTKLRTISNRY